MSTFNSLETTIAAETAATLQKIAAIAVRIIQRNASTQHLQVDDSAVYTDLKRQAANSGAVSTIPAGHICRGGN